MSNIQINTKKDYWGKWVAESEVPLEGKQVLKIHTSKSERGDLVSIASVCEVERDNGFRVERFTMFSDYLKTVYVAGKKVATEKAVRAQQALVLQDLPYILDNVKAFYAEKAAA